MSSGPSHFVVMATGQIEGAKFEGHDSLYCRYAFSMGEDWTVMKGVEERASRSYPLRPEPQQRGGTSRYGTFRSIR